jgi:hypothetical protein
MRTALRVATASALTSAVVAAGGFATAASAQPVAVGNLVNVQITNLLNNNDVAVAVPISAAANICGFDVNVLATDLADGPVTCDARSGQQTVTITQ